MLRYYAIATALVLGIAILATAWANRDLIRIKIRGTDLRAPAKPYHDAPSTKRPGDFVGDAPWALSALPECLHQQATASGTVAFVRTQLPADATEVAPHTTMTYADCTISYTGDEALVTRGHDRFRIPPHARFYRSSQGLVLEFISNGRADMRVYTQTAR